MTVEARIRRIIDQLTSAWNTGDAAAWGSVFSDDASFVNILGMPLAGRAQIAERHAVMFRTVFAGSRCVTTLASLVQLDDCVAIASLALAVTGQRTQPGGLRASDPDGTLRTWMLCVLTRTAGGDDWMIVAAQNTAIAPLAGVTAH
jgi:uncharacterized protein (TIGR02246 family)